MQTFIVSVNPAFGVPEITVSEQELPNELGAVEQELYETTDWDGSIHGNRVLCVGAEVHPGLDFGWMVLTERGRQEHEANVRDEQLGELTGAIPADAPGRSVGTPTVESEQ